MANKKKTAAKSKTKASKYTKLMKAASKELADKKKALVKAERALATATKNHQELVQETARLDMLERSLKALVDGTEPPQNVRYVYTYPYWVWSWPNYYNTPTFPPTFTTQPNWVGYNTPNLGTAIGGNINNGSSGSLVINNGTYSSPTVTCTLANSGDAFTFTNSSVPLSGVQTTPCGNSDGSGLTLNCSGGSNLSLTNSAPQWQNANDGSLVVDLTTHEPYEESARSEDMPKVMCDDLVEA